MTAQVRLEPDVAGLVAARQQADGCSMTQAANRLLREQHELVTFLAGFTPPPVDPGVAVVQPSRRPRPTLDPPAFAARPPEYPPADGAFTRTLRDGCQHPALSRRAGVCGKCGAPV